MKLEVGKTYLTRSGQLAIVESTSPFPSPYPYIGKICNRSVGDVLSSWREDGSWGVFHDIPRLNDIVLEQPDAYECWMIKAKGYEAIPVPNEEVAKSWAKKNGGRYFKVREIL